MPSLRFQPNALRVDRQAFIIPAAALLALGAPLALPRLRAHTIVVAGGDTAALTVALARARPGDTVYLRKGTYSLTEALAPPSGTRLQGAGQDQTLLRYAGTRPSALLDLSDRRDVRVSALTLDAAGNPRVPQAIFARNAARLRIDHVTIRRLASDGLGIHFSGDSPSGAHGVTDSRIEGCLLEQMGVGSEWGGGIRLSWGSARNRVVDNLIRETGRGGIFADNGSGDLTLCRNTVSGSHGEGLGLEVWGTCDRCLIEDNRLDHWLSISGCDRCAARRNVIRAGPGDAKYIGIEVIGSDEVITDNVVDGGQQIGLSVSNDARKDRVFWGYDRVERCIQWGAQLQGDRTGLADHYFYRCRFDNNGMSTGRPVYPGDAGHGFRINANARHVVLDSCDVSGNRGVGVQVIGSASAPADDLRFVRCRLRNNRKAAASIWPGSRSVTWQDCVAAGNADDALPQSRGAAAPAYAVTIEAPPDIRAGQRIDFALRAPLPAGTFTSVLWDFGDGIPGTAVAAAHVYSRLGRYRVSLLAWDAHGEAAHCERRITVR